MNKSVLLNFNFSFSAEKIACFPHMKSGFFLTTFLFSSGAFFIMTRLNALNISCAQKFRVKDSFLSHLHRFVINKEYIIYPKKLIMLTLLRHNTAHVFSCLEHHWGDLLSSFPQDLFSAVRQRLLSKICVVITRIITSKVKNR